MPRQVTAVTFAGMKELQQGVKKSSDPPGKPTVSPVGKMGSRSPSADRAAHIDQFVTVDDTGVGRIDRLKRPAQYIVRIKIIEPPGIALKTRRQARRWKTNWLHLRAGKSEKRNIATKGDKAG